jgi:AcrR family transcriptional regulator
MDEALRLFAREGFAGTAVTDIEAAAGLSPGSGSFYRHFRSKEDVLLATVDRELDRIRQRAANSQPPPEIPAGEMPERVGAQLREGLQRLKELSPLITILVRDGSHFPELAARVQEVVIDGRVIGGMEDVVAAAAAGGRDPAATAVVAMMASVGYHLATSFTRGAPGGVGPDRFADALAQMITAPPARRRPRR